MAERIEGGGIGARPPDSECGFETAVPALPPSRVAVGGGSGDSQVDFRSGPGAAPELEVGPQAHVLNTRHMHPAAIRAFCAIVFQPAVAAIG